MQGQGQRHVQKLRDAGEVAYQIGLHVAKSGSAGREMPQGGHANAWRACCTVSLGATAAGAFWFVLRNPLGTWNVPNLLCQAKTPSS